MPRRIEILRDALRDYQEENEEEYDNLLISRNFYDEMIEEESRKLQEDYAPLPVRGNITLAFERMEIRDHLNEDFRIIPE